MRTKIVTVIIATGIIASLITGGYVLAKPESRGVLQVTPTPIPTPVPFFDVGQLGPIISNMPKVIGSIIETFAQNGIDPYRITDVIFGTPTPILPNPVPKGQ